MGPATSTASLLWLTFLLLFWASPSAVSASGDERSLTALNAHDLKALVAFGDPEKNLDPHDPKSYLSRILIPRPAGSENNTVVRKYIVDTLKNLKWHVEEEDTFTAQTPYGVKPFTNIIATWHPEAPKRLVLSAHFDSKYFANPPHNQFVGATDSAAPCAMLLDLAQSLAPLLEARTKRLKASDDEDEEEQLDTTVQLIFFDGEEAFKDWTGKDNTYGARYLAEKWSGTSPATPDFLTPTPSGIYDAEYYRALRAIRSAGSTRSTGQIVFSVNGMAVRRTSVGGD